MVTVASGLSENHRQTFSKAERWDYFANGYDPMLAWDSVLSAAVTAGFLEPTAATVPTTGASGLVSIGTHFIRYRYKDKSTGYVSDPNTQATFVAPASKQIDVTKTASADARIDAIIFEMTTAGGSEFFEAGVFDNDGDAESLNISDTTLSEQVLDYDDTGHERPPIGRLHLYHRGYMFVGGPEEHDVGAASCVGSTAAVTFSGADIRVAMSGGFFLKSGDARVYEIASVDSTGDSGAISLAETYPTSFSDVGYRFLPANPNVVYYSSVLRPEAFDLTTRQFRVIRETSGQLRAIAPYRSSLLFFGDHSIERLDWELDPGDTDDGRLSTISTVRGALSQECVVVYMGIAYAMDQAGIYAWAGGRPKEIMRGLRDLLDNVDYTKWELFSASFDPATEEIYFFVVYGAETEPQTAFVYNTRTGGVYTEYYDRPITAMAVVEDGSRKLRTGLGTTDGATWYSHVGYSDGVRPGTTMSAAVGTGALPLIIPIPTAGLDTTGFGLAGVSAYWVEGDEVGVVASNTNNVLTLISGKGFSTGPSVGHTIQLGRIVSILRSKKFRMSSPSNDQKPVSLIVEFEKLPSVKTLKLRVYEDGSSTAKQDWAANTALDGVTYQASNPNILIDLSTEGGKVEVPLGDIWQRTVEFEFIVDAPDVPMSLIRYHLRTEIEELKDK
jgi:hypothetical protein